MINWGNLGTVISLVVGEFVGGVTILVGMEKLWTVDGTSLFARSASWV